MAERWNANHMAGALLSGGGVTSGVYCSGTMASLDGIGEYSGLDVLVPIELDVSDATYPGGNSVKRIKSKETMHDFMACFSTLIKQAKSDLEKKWLMCIY